MAVKPVMQTVCDVCQRPVESDTIRFGWDMSHYEVDLCPEHAEQLMDVMERTLRVARRLGAPPRSVSVPAQAPLPRQQVPITKVRAWARSKGIEVSERGRIPDEVFEKYLAAHRS